MRLLNHINRGKVIRLVNQPTQRIAVIEDPHYLWLTFDNIIQSVMLKRKPERLLMPHQQALLIPLLFSSPKNILELGLGGGSFTRAITHLLPEANLITAEYDSDVITLFRAHFNPTSRKYSINHQTGESLLQQQHGKYDWVVCDIYAQHNHQFLEQVKESIANMRNPACWTINLPDLDEKQLNALLAELKQTAFNLYQTTGTKYQVSYLEIPRFKNVIVYILPEPCIELDSTHSSLPAHLRLRLSTAWRSRQKVTLSDK